MLSLFYYTVKGVKGLKDNLYLKERLMSMGQNVQLRDLQAYIDEMVNIRGWAGETPQDTLLLLTEELGELAKEVRKSCTAIQTDLSRRSKADLEGERADVFLVLMALCRTLNIDLTRAFIRKELINCDRKWG